MSKILIPINVDEYKSVIKYIKDKHGVGVAKEVHEQLKKGNGLPLLRAIKITKPSSNIFSFIIYIV